MKNLEQKIQKAKELGKAAFYNDVHAAALDADLMAMIKGSEVGDGSAKLLKAWVDAHNIEMINQPFDYTQ